MPEAISHGYLHGYSPSEQQRLFSQADFLENYIFEKVDYSDTETLIEIGCGVGAQTEVLLRRFPQLHITAIDYSPTQIQTATRRLSRPLTAGKVRLELADASHLPYRDQQFDGGFVCWVLEHVAQPSQVLGELFRVVRPGGRVSATEVLNTPIFISPTSPAIAHYWDQYNQHQRELGGAPNIGAYLPGLFLSAGFSSIETHLLSYHLDRRLDPAERKRFLDYWRTLFLSAAPSLSEAQRIRPADIARMENEFTLLEKDSESVFFLMAMQVHARRPAQHPPLKDA
jgi:ubiquinone/menaquinone biosynthesis C-methylase UbiE